MSEKLVNDEEWKRQNRPSDPVLAAQWDKDFVFLAGDQWNMKELDEANKRAELRASSLVYGTNKVIRVTDD